MATLMCARLEASRSVAAAARQLQVACISRIQRFGPDLDVSFSPNLNLAGTCSGSIKKGTP